MSVFLSYSAADREFAQALREELRHLGISVSTANGVPASGWSERLEEAIGSAEDILVLVGPQSGEDEAQKLTWRMALEAVWQDSRKRLVPVLLHGVSLPPFVHGDSWGGSTQVLQVRDSANLSATARAIGAALRRGDLRSSSPDPFSPPPDVNGDYDAYPPLPSNIKGDFDAPPAPPPTKTGYYGEAAAERSERLSEIEQFAERLKH